MKLNRWMIHMFPLFPLGYSGLGKIEATLLAGWNCGRLAPKVAPPYTDVGEFPKETKDVVQFQCA